MILIFSIFGKGIPSQDEALNKTNKLTNSYDDDDSQGSVNRQTDGGMDAHSDEGLFKETRITREDIKMHISGSILSMVNVSFENGKIEGIKQ